MGNYDKTALNESRLWLAEAEYREGNYKEAAKLPAGVCQGHQQE